MKHQLGRKIVLILYKVKKGMTLPQLLHLLGGDKKRKEHSRNSVLLKKTLSEMVTAGIIVQQRGSYKLSGRAKLFEGEVSRVFRAHGFITRYAANKEPEDYFVRGKDLLGCVPGDRVLARIVDEERGAGRASSAKVIAIFAQSESTLTGVIVADRRTLYLLPDSFVSEPLPILDWGGYALQAGDKVAFRIRERGQRHSEHVVDITHVYGNANKARISVEAYLDERHFVQDFPPSVLDEARHISHKGITSAELDGRLDLREDVIFTIDGADTKDIDDAVSITQTKNGYRLGVHIADVSHYVKMGSELDKEAFRRGTSVYIADMVIPMLPKELSNGICSLNPNEDRLAFSCLMELSSDGTINSYTFKKSVIRSRLQGVYSEVNAILDETASPEILVKYAGLIDSIRLMRPLAEQLKQNREKRGAIPINAPESKILCDENGICIDIQARTPGVAESIIEEFMLCANNAAAKYAMQHELPFVYRVHEPPTAEKLMNLSKILVELGLDNLHINENSTTEDLANVLRAVEGSERAHVLNTMVLRTMMKAKYAPEPVGHYGLVMQEYAHFTSPIRRYPDLSIHRILTDAAAGLKPERLARKYGKFVVQSSIQSSNAELAAVNAERDCDKFYMAEFMKLHVGEPFDGIISGVISNGLFVVLPNTVEGMIGVDALPNGIYETESNLALVEQVTKTRYTIGDKVRVCCEGASVAAGTVDFSLVSVESDDENT